MSTAWDRRRAEAVRRAEEDARRQVELKRKQAADYHLRMREEKQTRAVARAKSLLQTAGTASESARAVYDPIPRVAVLLRCNLQTAQDVNRTISCIKGLRSDEQRTALAAMTKLARDSEERANELQMALDKLMCLM